eukprot:CAMPEP_0116917554 /NCGR_PEP_ID=MMETSP0467-20121206/19219_1 /TAXON_ID=283647 /ORGANISM="Mesodinium pulex, Strain SPMC105" /LENGTH=136 /DNA_ID=CAMNT_0004594683 /DNA_START=1161 /DNA_END=1571 /DNA_ORIENTATION=-
MDSVYFSKELFPLNVDECVVTLQSLDEALHILKQSWAADHKTAQLQFDESCQHKQALEQASTESQTADMRVQSRLKEAKLKSELLRNSISKFYAEFEQRQTELQQELEESTQIRAQLETQLSDKTGHNEWLSKKLE